MQSFFISCKSALDVYAQLISKLIQPQSTLRGFSKATYEGRKEFVGGTLLNCLECNSPEEYLNKRPLIKLLTNHIDNWISDLVRYRDQIVHFGNINKLSYMCVELSKKPQQIIKDEIQLPIIPDKGDLLAYCNHLLQNIKQILRETLPLLPNVDLKLPSP